MLFIVTVCAKHVHKLDDHYSETLEATLKESYETKCICASLDIWTDPYRQISYVNISISFIVENSIYKSLDFCCQHYLQQDHTGRNILIVRITFSYFFLLLSSLYSLKKEVSQNGTQHQNLKKGATVGYHSVKLLFLKSKTEELIASIVS